MGAPKVDPAGKRTHKNGVMLQSIDTIVGFRCIAIYSYNI